MRRAAACAFALALMATPASADPWKDESGQGWHPRFHAPGAYYEGKPGKYEWQAGGCKYEYKVDGRGYKEERTCDFGPSYYAAFPPPAHFYPWGQQVEEQAPRFTLGPQVASESGQYCREFQKQVTVGGERQDAYGIACRRPDGQWELVAE